MWACLHIMTQLSFPTFLANNCAHQGICSIVCSLNVLSPCPKCHIDGMLNDSMLVVWCLWLFVCVCVCVCGTSQRCTTCNSVPLDLVVMADKAAVGYIAISVFKYQRGTVFFFFSGYLCQRVYSTIGERWSDQPPVPAVVWDFNLHEKSFHIRFFGEKLAVYSRVWAYSCNSRR